MLPSEILKQGSEISTRNLFEDVENASLVKLLRKGGWTWSIFAAGKGLDSQAPELWSEARG